LVLSISHQPLRDSIVDATSSEVERVDGIGNVSIVLGSTTSHLFISDQMLNCFLCV